MLDARTTGVKWGSGRAAWGSNGGGHTHLGAGELEDDGGVELDEGASEEVDVHEAGQLRDHGTYPPPPPASASGPRWRGPSSRADGVGDGDGNDAHSHRAPSFASSRRTQSWSGALHSARSRAITALGRALGPKAASRMGVQSARPPAARRTKWNGFKKALFVSNVVVLIYSVIVLAMALLTYGRVWSAADVILALNGREIALLLSFALLSCLSAHLGLLGVLLNNRQFLSLHTLLLLPSLALLLAPGYVAYRTRSFNLDGKLNYAWSRTLSLSVRARIQDALQCCGYYTPFVEAASTGPACYARSTLPGCKGALLRLERRVLRIVYEFSFGLAGLHLCALLVALLAAEHVTHRFGTGVTPRAYRRRADGGDAAATGTAPVPTLSAPTSRTHLLLPHSPMASPTTGGSRSPAEEAPQHDQDDNRDEEPAFHAM